MLLSGHSCVLNPSAEHEYSVFDGLVCDDFFIISQVFDS